MKPGHALILFLVFLFACSRPATHPIYGKWKLAQVADSVVVNNPDEITIEFFEDGKVVTTGGPEPASEAKFIISDDTTLISIMEGGKVVDELKLLRLSQSDMVIAEGKESVRFIKVQ